MPEQDEVVSLPELDKSLLPHYQEWLKKEQPPLSATGLWDYLYDISNYDIAAAFSKVFWPEFIEVDGLVFLAERYPKLVMSPEEYRQKREENPASIEWLVNHIDIPYLFHISDTHPFNEEGILAPIYESELYDYLARTLIVSWKHALKEAFPDREFVFSYDSHEITPTVISFWQAK